MKKIITAVCLTAALFATQAQTVKIMKNGVAVASFNASEFDEVVFSPEDNQPGLYDLAGAYKAHLAVSLVEMPQQGVLIEQDTEFFVTVTAENAMTLTLPGCYYAAMQMEMPGLTLENVEVVESDGVYAFTKEYAFTEEGTGKAVSGTVTGTISSDLTFSITNLMKYGSMPFTLNEVFTPIAE